MSIQHFDPLCQMHLLTDASRLKGIRYALTQFDSDDLMSLFHCSSRSLKLAEQRYATVELECPAITWAITEHQYHLLGCPNPFTVVTDHCPLLGVFSKDLPTLKNTRLQHKVTDYQFNVTWAPGKSHLIADALSRALVFTPLEDDKENDELAEYFAITVNLAVHDKITPCIDEHYIAIREALEKDKRLAKLPADHPARSFKSVRHQLSTDGTLILLGGRIVVPKPAQAKIKDLLHIPHNGIMKTLQAARQMYYWPRMTSDITSLVEKCEACQIMRLSQCHKKLQPSVANFPMEMVSADIFEFNTHHYLIMVDRYSGYPWIH